MSALETAPGSAPWRVVTEPRGGGWWQIVFIVRGERRALFVPRWFPETVAAAMAEEVAEVVRCVLAAVEEDRDGIAIR